MAYRITAKFLDAQCERLNTLTDSPQTAYVRKEGRNIPQSGHYHISCAYDGYSLHRRVESGGVQDVFRCGHIKAHELSERISAYEEGIRAEEENSP